MNSRHLRLLAALLLGASLSACGGGGGGGSPSGPSTTRYTLTVSRSGAGSGTVTGTGISCGETCTAPFPGGASVTLTATPASGSTFSGWGGACTGTAATCTVSMSEDRAVTAGFAAEPAAPGYVVAIEQSSKAQATDLSAADVAALVQSAVAAAGGLDFIADGMTVVLKPNLLTATIDGTTQASPTVNGIDTDWRVAKAVADLVRARDPHGKILIMEGSVNRTTTAFSILGYTPANFGGAVDEFIALEGASCADTSTAGLEQKAGPSGKSYWINSRYLHADVVIDLPVMKTHATAGITGAVKNLGVGTTPVGQFSRGNGSSDCTRGQSSAHIDHASAETLGAFIRDYYSLRPPDFVVMDALQGLEHGPLPAWDDSGLYAYGSSLKNMRLILAGRNAVAVDTIAAQVMMCDPRKVPYLTKLEADGKGTTDAAKITVVGKQVSEVARPFAGKQTGICPGGVPGGRPGGAACQAASYPTPILTGAPRLLYQPAGAASGTFEGPVWLPASSTLLFSDITFSGSVHPSQLLRSTAAGAVTSLIADAGVNGMSVDGNGVVYAASHKVQGIVRLNLADRILTTVVSAVGGKKFNSPNDLVIRADGTLYFTDPDFQLGARTSETGLKGVYRVSPGGAASLVDGTFTEPNGIALSPDQRVLYVTDYGANAVRAFTVAADGSASARRDFATVSSPDGLAVDCAGNLYVASGSSGRVQVFSPAGTALGNFSVAPGVSNLAFGGADGRTLFITAGKALYALDMNLPGYSN